MKILPTTSIPRHRRSGIYGDFLGLPTRCGGSWRGPSIAGFQLRDLQSALPGNSPAALTGLTQLPDGTFQFHFTNQPGASFTVLTTTNVALPASDWLNLGVVPNCPPAPVPIHRSAGDQSSAPLLSRALTVKLSRPNLAVVISPASA
ncbi:MAG: hypothetical protein QM813_15220 [Verrucomicrobiota bacterium]